MAPVACPGARASPGAPLQTAGHGVKTGVKIILIRVWQAQLHHERWTQRPHPTWARSAYPIAHAFSQDGNRGFLLVPRVQPRVACDLHTRVQVVRQPWLHARHPAQWLCITPGTKVPSYCYVYCPVCSCACTSEEMCTSHSGRASMARSCVASYCERRYSMKGRCAASGGHARCTYAASAAASAASASRSGASRDSSSCGGNQHQLQGSALITTFTRQSTTELRPHAGSWPSFS